MRCRVFVCTGERSAIHEISPRAARRPLDPATLLDLVNVLARHPDGLRRWSVMRAIRDERTRTHREIPQRLEDTVERIFRSRCEDFLPKTPSAPTALFYLQKEKPGEVWAVHLERVGMLLAETSMP